MKELAVKDGIIDESLLNDCIMLGAYAKRYSMMHGAGTGFSSEGTQVLKSSWLLYDMDKPADENMEDVSRLPEPFDKLWEQVKPHVGENIEMYRAYVNAHTYGSEDNIHTDDDGVSKGKTVIVYLCNRWNPEWSGQTVFYNERDILEKDIVYSCLPKYNRVVIFDKTIPHAVAPISRRYMGLRLTCMFKVEDLDGRDTTT